MAEAICSAPRCDRPVGSHGARGLCSRCYKRVCKFGSTELPTTVERFFARVDKHGPAPEYRPELGPCWIWQKKLTKAGYGRFGYEAKVVLAHRFACELLVGPIPKGLEPDHLCKVPACVKAVADEHGPAHLEVVTHQVNMRRSRKGSATHCPKGHPYDEANTYWYKGWRSCRLCHRDRQR